MSVRTHGPSLPVYCSDKLECRSAGKVQRLEQQLRQLQQQKEDASMQLLFLRDEALELRQAKDAAVVEKEQLVIRCERRNQQLQVCVEPLRCCRC